MIEKIIDKIPAVDQSRLGAQIADQPIRSTLHQAIIVGSDRGFRGWLSSLPIVGIVIS